MANMKAVNVRRLVDYLGPAPAPAPKPNEDDEDQEGDGEGDEASPEPGKEAGPSGLASGKVPPRSDDESDVPPQVNPNKRRRRTKEV